MEGILLIIIHFEIYFRPNFEQIRKIIIFYSMWCHFQKIPNFNNLSTCQIYRNIWSHGDQEKRPSISSEESISDYEQVVKINNLEFRSGILF